MSNIFIKVQRRINKECNKLKTNCIRSIDPNLINTEKRLFFWKNRFLDHRCFIMGNGPSLNKMDLSIFHDEYVWGSNKCYLLFPGIDWRPKFYVAVDTRVVPDIRKEIKNQILKLKDTACFFPVQFRESFILPSKSNVFWYQTKELNSKNLPYSAFSLHADNFIYTVTTVTIAAIQLAVYMGFNPIYLIGCDTSYNVPKTIVYENQNQDALISTQDDDYNHFDKSYFGKGAKWHPPKVENMLFHYAQVKKICDELGVEVINATVGGKLEIFPRIDYKELFK